MSKRPIRDAVEEVIDKTPDGPLGIAGDGTLVGLSGYSVVTLANNVSPLPVGYKVEGKKVSRDGDVERHVVKVWSASRNVAEFVSRMESLGPTLNIIDNSEINGVERLRERRHHTLWKITVDVERNEVG